MSFLFDAPDAHAIGKQYSRNPNRWEGLVVAPGLIAFWSCRQHHPNGHRSVTAAKACAEGVLNSERAKGARP